MLGVLAAIAAGVVSAGLFRMNPLAAPLIVAALAVLVVARDPWKGVVLLLLAAQFNIFRYDFGPYTIRPEQVVFLLAFAVWIAFFLQGRSKIYSTVLDIPILGLIITGFVSSYLFSPDPAYSYQGLFLQILYMSMYFYTVNVLLNNRSRFDFTVKVMMFFASLHALYAIVAFVAHFAGLNIGGISLSHLVTLSFPSTSGFFQEANLLAAYTGVMLMLFIVHLVTYGKERIAGSRYLWLGFILLFIVLLTSMTRAAWLGVLLVMIALPFYSRPAHNIINPKALAFLVVALMVFAIVFPIVNFVFSEASGTSDALLVRMQNLLNFETGSARSRSDVQDAAIEEWRNNPYLGYGVLSIGEKGNVNRGWLFSSGIQSLHDMGLVGLFFMAWIHIIPIIYGFMASARARDNMRRASLFGMSLGAIVMAVASQASSFFWLGFPWIYLGILVALSKATMDEAKEAQTEGRAILNG